MRLKNKRKSELLVTRITWRNGGVKPLDVITSPRPPVRGHETTGWDGWTVRPDLRRQGVDQSRHDRRPLIMSPSPTPPEDNYVVRHTPFRVNYFDKPKWIFLTSTPLFDVLLHLLDLFILFYYVHYRKILLKILILSLNLVTQNLFLIGTLREINVPEE